jgi:hypothetical protein
MELWQQVEVGMHLVFKGVVTTMVMTIQEWLKQKNKYEEFLRYVQPPVESVRQLKLDWLRIEPYT